MKRQSYVIATPQRGAVLPLVVIGLVAIIGMAGLALDLGHAYVNKTRLQNALDAAALSGAKTLDITSDTGQARAAARNTFDLTAGAAGNQELAGAVSGADLTVEFSNTLFDPATATAPKYIRVRNNSFTRPTWLVRVFNMFPGVDLSTITVGASAVAGPSPTIVVDINNVVPLVVCDDQLPPGTIIAEPGTAQNYLGPGNYGLVEFDECGDRNAPATGCPNDLSCFLAGSQGPDISVGDTCSFKTGENTNPVHWGINSRFNCARLGNNDCSNSTEDQSRFPPDPVTRANATVDTGQNVWGQQDYNDPATSADTYPNYLRDYATPTWDTQPRDAGTAVHRRREVVVLTTHCGGAYRGQSQPFTVTGFVCYFLAMPQILSNDQRLFATPIENCLGNGIPGSDPGAGPGPYRIQLYKDPASPDA